MATGAVQTSSTLTIQACPAWKAWASGFAEFLRTDRSKLVDVALAELATRRGYAPVPPPRWPINGGGPR